MVQRSGPPLVWTMTWRPTRRLRTSYRAPGPPPSISTWPSRTSSDVDGIHHPTSAGLPGTASAPAVATSASAGAEVCRLGIWIESAPRGSTAGMTGAAATAGRAVWPAARVAATRAGLTQAGAGPALGRCDWWATRPQAATPSRASATRTGGAHQRREYRRWWAGAFVMPAVRSAAAEAAEAAAGPAAQAERAGTGQQQRAERAHGEPRSVVGGLRRGQATGAGVHP